MLCSTAAFTVYLVPVIATGLPISFRDVPISSGSISGDRRRFATFHQFSTQYEKSAHHLSEKTGPRLIFFNSHMVEES